MSDNQLLEQPANSEGVPVEVEQEESKSVDPVSDQISEPEEAEYYEIEGIQATAKEIRDWKSAHEKKRDTDKAWTEKTQKLSDERKKFESDQKAFSEKMALVESLESEIERLALGDMESVDLDKILEEYGSEEFLKAQRELEKRNAKATSLKEKLNQARQSNAEKSYKHLADSLGWDDASKRESDIQSIQQHVKAEGIPAESFARVSEPWIMTALLDQAKYKELMNRTKETEKRVKAAPKVSRPAATTSAVQLTLAERLYGKKTG